MTKLIKSIGQEFYRHLLQKVDRGACLTPQEGEAILLSPEIEIISLVEAAFQLRKKYFGKEVTVHIINNAENGRCSEDCHYCAQSRISKAKIESYSLKSDEEILAEAKIAYESGAYRYCVVFAGKGPSAKRVDHFVELIKKIKAQYPMEVCVSPGIVDREGIKKLKAAGLNRLNHNLNTSEKHYAKICTTHTYSERLNTLQAAKEIGLDVCSGIIVGMGEEPSDIVEVALRLREFNARSIPVNFLIPIKGNPLDRKPHLTPEYCLRVLCLFRFFNPDSDIRIAAGREWYLKGMEVLALYPANSLFLDGYLNTKGSSRVKTLRMIKEAGFTISSTFSVDELLKKEEDGCSGFALEDSPSIMKDSNDLHPSVKSQIT